jgi:hypothetical protein
LGIFHIAADISSAEPIAALWDWTLAIGPPGKAWRPTARGPMPFPYRERPEENPSPGLMCCVLGFLAVVVSGQNRPLAA